MITNDDLLQAIGGDDRNVEIPLIGSASMSPARLFLHFTVAEIATELLALREQNRWRKYPDEKPEIRQRIWICLKDDDDEVLGEFEYTAVFCQYCNTFAPHFDGYERFIHPNFTGTLLWRPLPSAPDAKGGE